MEYIINIEGKYHHYCGKTIPSNGIEVKNWEGISGDPIELYDESGRRLSGEQLVDKGILEDNRGTYFDTENCSRLVINQIGEKIPEGFTDTPPIPGAMNKWNGKKWIDAGAPPVELFTPLWSIGKGWYEGEASINDDMKKQKRKFLLNDYMLDLMEEGTYTTEAMQKKALELKELIK